MLYKLSANMLCRKASQNTWNLSVDEVQQQKTTSWSTPVGVNRNLRLQQMQELKTGQIFYKKHLQIFSELLLCVFLLNYYSLTSPVCSEARCSYFLDSSSLFINSIKNILNKTNLQNRNKELNRV